MCRWQVEVEDVEVVHEMLAKHHQYLTSRPLLRLLGLQLLPLHCAAGSQGDPSNLQRFKSHHPSTFIGGGDPMVADHWF